jgi:hypothetical protein
MVLLVVKQGYERGEYWSGKDDGSRNMRAEKDLFIVESFIISASKLAVLFL